MNKFEKCVVMILLSVLALSNIAFASSQEAAYKHNSEGLEKLKNNDYKGAISEFKSARQYLPSNDIIKKNLSAAYNNYAFSLMKQGRLNEAIDQFEKAFYYDKSNAFILYNIGQAYYKNQNMKRAKEYLEKAYSIDTGIKGLKGLLDKVSSEVRFEKSFDRLGTMHFIIAAAPDVEVDKLSYIRTYLEESYGRVGGFLDHYPSKRLVAVLYSENSYNKLLNDKPYWMLAAFDGKLRIPVNKFKYTNEEIIKIIYHEYAHAVIYDIAGGKVPLWLNEGIASKVEDFAGYRDRELFKKYIDKFGFVPFREMPADFTSVGNRDIVTLLYIESYLLVDFIIKKVGQSGVKDILEYLNNGASIGQAMGTVLKMDLDQFEREWERYVKEKCGVRELKPFR